MNQLKLICSKIWWRFNFDWPGNFYALISPLLCLWNCVQKAFFLVYIILIASNGLYTREWLQANEGSFFPRLSHQRMWFSFWLCLQIVLLSVWRDRKRLLKIYRRKSNLDVSKGCILFVVLCPLRQNLLTTGQYWEAADTMHWRNTVFCGRATACFTCYCFMKSAEIKIREWVSVACYLLPRRNEWNTKIVGMICCSEFFVMVQIFSTVVWRFYGIDKFVFTCTLSPSETIQELANFFPIVWELV